jgi:pyruvate formate lyase activating enzyme
MPAPRVVSRFQTKRENGSCRCEVCPRHCVIAPGKTGFCGHYGQDGGELIAIRYGRIAAAALDPIEKKPLYHFHPGAAILSVGANGCNLSCKFCQNWHLSAGLSRDDYLAPERLAAQAGEGGSIGVAFTYNEPTIWFPYIVDAAVLLRAKSLAVVLVTNGYLEAEPWDELCGHVQAMNIDVKGDEAFYPRMTGGRLAPVRRNVEAAHAAGVHVEVTNLLVTDENDQPDQVRDLVDWLAGVSPDIPLHFSRYFPNREWNAPPTPASRLKEAVELARQKLRYVYAGNISLPNASDTACHACGALVVRRSGYSIDRHGLRDGSRCTTCGTKLPIVT